MIVQFLEYYVKALPGGDLIWKFLMNPIGETQQILVDFATNPSQALVTWGPLLFALGYQAFFEPVGWGTWGVPLSSPAWVPTLLGVGLAVTVAGILDFLNQLTFPDFSSDEAPVPSTTDHHWPAAATSLDCGESRVGSPGAGVGGDRCSEPRTGRRSVGVEFRLYRRWSRWLGTQFGTDGGWPRCPKGTVGHHPGRGGCGGKHRASTGAAAQAVGDARARR